MAWHIRLYLLVGLSVACLLVTAPHMVLATIVFDDHFTGNSGGIPAGWSRIYGTGAVVETGTTVTLGDDIVVIGSDATIDPSSGTVRVVTDIASVVGQVASGLVGPGDFPAALFICEIRRDDGRIEVGGGDAAGGIQNYDLGYLVGYAGGSIRLTITLGSTWFSVSTDSPPFASGPIDYTTAFATFTRDDLGTAASVMLMDFEHPGSSIVDRVMVDVGETSMVVDDGGVPATPALFPPYPNPFNPRSTVSFTLPSAGHAVVEIFDAKGRLVAQLVDEVLAAGRHAHDWDGRDAHGAAMPSGTYFCRLTTAWGVETRKMGLIR